jgi:hypothetical protein
MVQLSGGVPDLESSAGFYSLTSVILRSEATACPELAEGKNLLSVDSNRSLIFP